MGGQILHMDFSKAVKGNEVVRRGGGGGDSARYMDNPYVPIDPPVWTSPQSEENDGGEEVKSDPPLSELGMYGHPGRTNKEYLESRRPKSGLRFDNAQAGPGSGKLLRRGEPWQDARLNEPPDDVDMLEDNPLQKDAGVGREPVDWRPYFIRGGADVIKWPSPASQRKSALNISQWTPEHANGDWTVNPLERMNMLENGIRFGYTFPGPDIKPEVPGVMTGSEIAAQNSENRRTQITIDRKLRPMLTSYIPMSTPLQRTGVMPRAQWQQAFPSAEVQNGRSTTMRNGRFRSNF